MQNNCVKSSSTLYWMDQPARLPQHTLFNMYNIVYMCTMYDVWLFGTRLSRPFQYIRCLMTWPCLPNNMIHRVSHRERAHLNWFEIFIYKIRLVGRLSVSNWGQTTFTVRMVRTMWNHRWYILSVCRGVCKLSKLLWFYRCHLCINDWCK